MAKNGGCKVYSNELLDALVDSGKKADGEMRQKIRDASLSTQSKCSNGLLSTGGGGRYGRKSGAKSTKSKVSKDVEEKKIMRNKAYWEKMGKLQEQSEREVRDRLEALRKKKEANFQQMFQSIIDGKSFTDEIDSMLEFHEQMELRKRVARYNDWNENVFGKIQKAILENLEEKGAQELNKLRREEYEKFLDVSNKKNSLFLDIVIESEYDPFEVNRNAIRCEMGDLDDPTKRAVKRYNQEKNMIPSMNSPVQPKTNRGTLPVPLWATGKVESTPHGYFSKLMKEKSEDECKQDGAKAEQYKSRIDIDHYSYPKGREVIDKEFPKGKRTDFSYLPFASKTKHRENYNIVSGETKTN